MIKKYIKCSKCHDLVESNELVYMYENIDVYPKREDLQAWKDDPDDQRIVEMHGVCRECGHQCVYCREWFNFEDIWDCDLCKKYACDFDTKRCNICDESFCKPDNEIIIKEKQLEDPLYESCYDKHRKQELYCNSCNRHKYILFDDVGDESFAFCMNCYDGDDRERVMFWAKGKPSCPWTDQEYDRRLKEDNKFINSSKEEQKRIRDEEDKKVIEEWCGTYLDTSHYT